MSDKCPSGADPQTCGSNASSCSGCSPSPNQEPSQEEKTLTRALKRIRHKLVVMSGKGGVGKSTVAVTLALSLARRGFRVGLMDVDLHGPNVCRMLGLNSLWTCTRPDRSCPRTSLTTCGSSPSRC